MEPGIRDELFWNRAVQSAVVRLGRSRGLNIRAYTPPAITIANDDDPQHELVEGQSLVSQW